MYQEAAFPGIGFTTFIHFGRIEMAMQQFVRFLTDLTVGAVDLSMGSDNQESGRRRSTGTPACCEQQQPTQAEQGEAGRFGYRGIDDVKVVDTNV